MMVVVDSSALIPLARAGRLSLIQKVYDEIYAPEEVYEETVKEGEGKPGTAELKEFFEGVEIEEADSKKSKEIAKMEGIAQADVSVVLMAEERNNILLANDKGLIEFARLRGVDCHWTTTLLLLAVKREIVSKGEGKEILYDLVDGGMNLKNKIYARILKEIDNI